MQESGRHNQNKKERKKNIFAKRKEKEKHIAPGTIHQKTNTIFYMQID